MEGAVKFDPAGPYTVYDGHQPSLEDLERSELFCKRIREAVGTRADLLFGTHGQFTVSGAKRMARRIEAYDPLWFEEPVPPEMPEQMHSMIAPAWIDPKEDPVTHPDAKIKKLPPKEITIKGAIGVTRTGYANAIRLLESRRYDVERMHTHNFDLRDAELAIRTLAREIPGQESIHSCLIPEQ